MDLKTPQEEDPLKKDQNGTPEICYTITKGDFYKVQHHLGRLSPKALLETNRFGYRILDSIINEGHLTDLPKHLQTYQVLSHRDSLGKTAFERAKENELKKLPPKLLYKAIHSGLLDPSQAPTIQKYKRGAEPTLNL